MKFSRSLNCSKFFTPLLFPPFLSGCADRTLNFPFHQVDQATPKVLEKLDISVLDHSEIENGKRIRASPNELDITINMQKVTMRATRVTINAKKNTLVKDKATAEAVINQLEIMLAPKMEKAPSPSRQKPLPFYPSNLP